MKSGAFALSISIFVIIFLLLSAVSGGNDADSTDEEAPAFFFMVDYDRKAKPPTADLSG